MEIPFMFLLFIITYFLTKHLLRRFKNQPPSPFPSLPIIGHLHLLKQPLSQTLANLAKIHGPVLLLQFGSRPVLIISSPSAAEECFTKNDIIFANRPKLLAGKHVGHDYTTIVWASYGQHWRNLRRLVSTQILSANQIQMFKSIRVDEVRRLLGRTYKNCSSGEYIKVDVRSVLFEVTLNNMMRMIAGKRYYGEGLEQEEETRKFQEIVTETFLLSGVTNLGDFIPILNWLGLNGLEKRLKELQHKRDAFMQDLIEEHRRENEGCEQRSKTMVDVLLSLKENEPEYYTDQIISGIMQIMLTAGSDTSTGTMEWALSLLLNHPAILKKAHHEIEKNITAQNRLIEESDLNELPYLNKIIKETLRMFPPNRLLLPHESSKECTIGGFHIPRGTMMMVNNWAIQNDPELWHEPNKFIPERWADVDDVRYSCMPFGLGRRGCPGEGLAMRVVGFVLGSLIQCFEWEREGEEMVDMTGGPGITTPKALPLVAKCRPRPAMVNLLSQLCQ